MTDPVEDDLVKLTVFLTPAAHADLEEAAEALGDTGTDTVNRALMVYNSIVEVAQNGGGRMGFDLTDGYRADLLVTRVSPQREIAPRA